MLNDRDDWVSSIVNEQKDKAYARKIFIGLSVAILLVALVILYLPIKINPSTLILVSLQL